MSSGRLYEVLHVAEVAQAELEDLLSFHFTRAMQLSEREIVYPGDETNFALKLCYDRQGSLKEITAGPLLTPAHIEELKSKIATALLASPGTTVGRIILFAIVPLEGFYRYKDRFQILPVPPEAPRPESFMADHPFILEFRFPTSSTASIRKLRRAILERELELVLASLLPYSIRAQGQLVRHHWVLLNSPKGPLTEFQYGYRQEMYGWSGFPYELDEWSSIEGMGEVPAKDPAVYYARFGISYDSRLEIPANLSSLLDTYFALDPSDRDRFLRASFWLQHAKSVYTYSRSATFTALISAIEVLIPEERAKHCKECRQPVRKVAQRFVAFVERLAPSGSVTEADRKRFYTIRSKLSHGGSLLPSDVQVWQRGLTPTYLDELDEISTTWRLVTVLVVNWLSERGVETSAKVGLQVPRGRQHAATLQMGKRPKAGKRK